MISQVSIQEYYEAGLDLYNSCFTTNSILASVVTKQLSLTSILHGVKFEQWRQLESDAVAGCVFVV